MNFVLEVDRGTMPVVRQDRLLRELMALEEALGNERNRERKARGKGQIEKARHALLAANASDRQSSFMKKFIAYYFGWRDKWHTQRFNWQNFRVLTVTSSKERIGTMQRALMALTGGQLAGMFLFATAEDVAAADDLLAMQWQDGKGDRVVLLP